MKFILSHFSNLLEKKTNFAKPSGDALLVIVSGTFYYREFMSDAVMIPRYNISLEEERDIALKRLQRICDSGFISVLDFRNNPLRIFAAHELAAIIDPAMTTKMTVQVSLIYLCLF